MKQLFVYAIIMLHTCCLWGQTLQEVKNLVDKDNMAAAKKAIDSYLADKMNAAKPDGWYYKGLIYNECSKREDMANLCTNCRLDAFEAFKTYQQLDPINLYMKLEQNMRLFDLYNGFFDAASKEFSGKNYLKAYNGFMNAVKVQEYIFNKGFEYNGFKFEKLDTSLIENAALAARLAGDDAKAEVQYKKLVDASVGGNKYLEIYHFLMGYYTRAKNKTALDAIIEKGKKIYPQDDYWLETEIDQLGRSNLQALFAKYDELIAKNPGRYNIVYNYSVELFNNIYVSEKRPADFETKKTKLIETLKKALAIKNSPDANMLMARTLYNEVYDLQEVKNSIKGTGVEDAKKRVALKEQGLKLADECIKYAATAEKIYASATQLKPAAKANYKNAFGILEAMYGFIGDAEKVAEYKKKDEML